MTARLREVGHLLARFFDVLSARPLSPGEQGEVARMLHSDPERHLFWDQPIADQRHGLGAARFVSGRHPQRSELVRAALLHDVGKRHARLGVAGRSMASLVRMAGLGGWGRIHEYIDHGALAADELEAAGAEPLVVAYARHHHLRRPGEVSPHDWATLNAADRVRR